MTSEGGISSDEPVSFEIKATIRNTFKYDPGPTDGYTVNTGAFYHDVTAPVKPFPEIDDDMILSRNVWALVTVLILATALAIFLINAIFLFVMVRCNTLVAKNQRFLFVSLAIADILVGIVVLPLMASALMVNDYFVAAPITEETRLLLRTYFCSTVVAAFTLCVTASIYTFCAIAIDRYFSIKSPVYYVRRLRKTVTKFSVGVAWVIAATITVTTSLANILLPVNEHAEESNYVCRLPENFYIVLFLLLTIYLVPLMIIGYSSIAGFFMTVDNFVRVNKNIQKAAHKTQETTYTSQRPVRRHQSEAMYRSLPLQQQKYERRLSSEEGRELPKKPVPPSSDSGLGHSGESTFNPFDIGSKSRRGSVISNNGGSTLVKRIVNKKRGKSVDDGTNQTTMQEDISQNHSSIDNVNSDSECSSSTQVEKKSENELPACPKAMAFTAQTFMLTQLPKSPRKKRALTLPFHRNLSVCDEESSTREQEDLLQLRYEPSFGSQRSNTDSCKAVAANCKSASPGIVSSPEKPQWADALIPRMRVSTYTEGVKFCTPLLRRRRYEYPLPTPEMDSSRVSGFSRSSSSKWRGRLASINEWAIERNVQRMRASVASKRNRRITIGFVVMVGLFAIFWTPFFVIFAVEYFVGDDQHGAEEHENEDGKHAEKYHDLLHVLGLWFATLYSSCSVLLNIIVNPKIRTAFKKIVCCCCGAQEKLDMAAHSPESSPRKIQRSFTKRGKERQMKASNNALNNNNNSTANSKTNRSNSQRGKNLFIRAVKQIMEERTPDSWNDGLSPISEFPNYKKYGGSDGDSLSSLNCMTNGIVNDDLSSVKSLSKQEDLISPVDIQLQPIDSCQHSSSTLCGEGAYLLHVNFLDGSVAEENGIDEEQVINGNKRPTFHIGLGEQTFLKKSCNGLLSNGHALNHSSQE